VTQTEELAFLEKPCAAIGEHFETVQIFVTRFDPELGTSNASFGSGNWFARRGRIQDWLVKKNEQTCVDVRKSEEET
jgi:hypothetical protein